MTKNKVIIGEEKFVSLGIDPNDPEALAPLFDSLTDQYGDPINDLTREVISNAIDATSLLPVEDRKPIEITSPTTDSPFFIVEDFGVGMTPETVENNYTSFLSSTKIFDLSQIGAHGQGAKAPLTYCSEYTVETVRDGVETVFSISRNSAGYKYRFISIEETDKGNGTKVIIPADVKDNHRFQQALHSYKNYAFDVGLIIDGVPFDVNENYVLLTKIALDDDGEVMGRVFIRKDSMFTLFTNTFAGKYATAETRNSYVLGGWIYSDPFKTADRYNSYGNTEPDIIVELVPGVVDFTKSRSDIIKNEKSEKLSNRIRAFFNSQNAMEEMLKIYRTFSKSEAAAFTRGLRYDDKSVLSKNIRFNNYNYSFEKFETNEGFNPFVLRYSDYATDSWAILNLQDSTNVRLYSKLDFATRLVRNEHGIRNFMEIYPSYSFAGHVSAVNERVVSDFETGTASSSLGDVLAGLSKEFTPRNFAETTVVILDGITEKNLKTVLATRKIMFENLNYRFVVLGKDLSQIKRVEQDFKGLVNFKYVEVSTLLEEVKEIRKANATTRSASKTVKYEFSQLGDFNGVVSSLKRTQDEPKLPVKGSTFLSLGELEDNDLVILGSYTRGDGVAGVIKSLYNQGYKKNPNVLVLNSTSLSAADFQRLLKVEDLYVTKDFRSYRSSKAYRTLKETRTLFSKYFNDSLESLTEPDLLSAFLFSGYPAHRVFLKEYANFLIGEQKNVDEAFLIMTAMDTKATKMAKDSLEEDIFEETIENIEFFKNLKGCMQSIITISRQNTYAWGRSESDFEADLLAKMITVAKKNVDENVVRMLLTLFDKRLENFNK